MVTGIVAAFAVLGVCALALLAVRRSRLESERRLELVLDRHRRPSAGDLGERRAGVARVAAAPDEHAPPLTLDFDELVDELVAEAAVRTGADAVVLRVEGPGGRPVVASFGQGPTSELAEQTLGPARPRAFRAATIDWTYSAAGEPDDERFHSALVAPLGSKAGIPARWSHTRAHRRLFVRSTYRR